VQSRVQWFTALLTGGLVSLVAWQSFKEPAWALSVAVTRLGPIRAACLQLANRNASGSLRAGPPALKNQLSTRSMDHEGEGGRSCMTRHACLKHVRKEYMIARTNVASPVTHHGSICICYTQEAAAVISGPDKDDPGAPGSGRRLTNCTVLLLRCEC
jgi:hypothetical protein